MLSFHFLIIESEDTGVINNFNHFGKLNTVLVTSVSYLEKKLQYGHCARDYSLVNKMVLNKKTSVIFTY